MFGRIMTYFGRSKPVHFLHIGKTGGTAVIEALNPVASQFGIVLHNHHTRLRDIPRDDRVFFFVRHPVPRFVSGFLSRLRRGAPRYHYEWSEAEARAFGRFQKPNELGEALSAEDPAIREQAQEAMRGIQHVSSSYREWFSGEQELDGRLDSIVLLGLQETLRSDFDELKRILNLPPTISLPADDVLAHRTPKGLDRHLSPLAEQNLRQWYSDDLRFYEHCLQLRARRTL